MRNNPNPPPHHCQASGHHNHLVHQHPTLSPLPLLNRRPIPVPASLRHPIHHHGRAAPHQTATHSFHRGVPATTAGKPTKSHRSSARTPRCTQAAQIAIGSPELHKTSNGSAFKTTSDQWTWNPSTPSATVAPANIVPNRTAAHKSSRRMAPINPATSRNHGIKLHHPNHLAQIGNKKDQRKIHRMRTQLRSIRRRPRLPHIKPEPIPRRPFCLLNVHGIIVTPTASHPPKPKPPIREWAL